MSDQLDLTRLPRGQREWRSFVYQISQVDDRAERYFLELKSELDLNKKEHCAKVAKFILGAANRAPERAARRFEGYAIMVLGVSRGKVIGIPSFEAKDLETAVSRYVGVGKPAWDFERVSVEGDRDVILIMVDPPTGGNIWTCLRDGPDGLRDGAIYIRADGETREAKGGEVRDLAARVSQQQPEAELEVQLEGVVDAVFFDADPLRDYASRIAAALRAEARPKRPNPNQTVSSRIMQAYTSPFWRAEDRSLEDYEAAIEEWVGQVLSSGSAIVDTIAGVYFPRNTVVVKNSSKRYLEDVEVHVHLEGKVRAVDVLTEDADLLQNLPHPPRKWGAYQEDLGFYPRVMSNYGAQSFFDRTSSNGIVSYRNGGSVNLTFRLDSLRPKGSFVSDDDDFLLVLDGTGTDGGTDGGEVRGTWTVTARGINDVLEGELRVPVLGGRDLTDVLRRLLSNEDKEASGETTD